MQQNKRVAGEDIRGGLAQEPIVAGGKHVVVVGGDTASDCTHRVPPGRGEGDAARSGRNRLKGDKLTGGPTGTKMRTSSSQRARIAFQVATLEFVGEDGELTAVKCCEVDEKRKPIAGTEFFIRADLAFIAIGFAGPFGDSVLKDMQGKLDTVVDQRRSTNVVANDLDYKTSVEGLFAAGDVRRGQSLVVWAIREGRQAARAVDEFLMGASVLPR